MPLDPGLSLGDIGIDILPLLEPIPLVIGHTENDLFSI
jgi:hypothetical protein